MLIVCPSCASEYTIEADRVGPTGRVVRCASCREAWFVASDLLVDARATDPAVVEPASAPRRPPSPSTRRPDKPAAAGRLALPLALCLAVGLGSAVLFRASVVRAVPESAAAFAAIGLPVNLVGLQLSGVSSEMGEETEGKVLVVEGEISNSSGHAVQVPAIALTIEGETGNLLYTWPYRARTGELAAGATTRFRARLASPPPDGRQVLVTFSTKAGPGTVASR